MSKQPPSSQKESKHHEHVEALRKIFTDGIDHKLFDHFYQTLTILDAKASSLLVFNAILIAAFAVFIPMEMPDSDRLVLLVGIGIIFLSCILLLLVVLVHWSHTRLLERGTNKYLIRLLKVRTRRTWLYRVAWVCSIAAVFCLGTIFLHKYPAKQQRVEPARSASTQS